MKKIMIQLSIVCFFSILCFTLLEKFNIKTYDCITSEVLSVFFTAITVLFSIGISVAMGVDLNEVVNRDKRSFFIIELKRTELSFCIFFILDCLSVLLMNVIQQLIPNSKTSNFFYTFFSTVILFSILYFLYNFNSMYNFKRKLEEHIFEEKHER